MSVIDLIYDTLKPTGIPVQFQTYTGSKETYITYFNYLQQTEVHTDDDESIEGYYTQVDIWSKKDYTQIVQDVKRLMKEAGFIRRNEAELYEQETKIHHKAIRYFYYK